MIKELITERIEDNKKMFTKKELKYIKKNIKLAQKIYILGMLDVDDDLYKTINKNGICM